MTGIDAAQKRGDAVHLQQLFLNLTKIADVEVVHRGKFPFLAGPIANGMELGSPSTAYRIIVYHLVLFIWLLRVTSSQTVLYCRDWSVALVGFAVRKVRKSPVVYEANSLVSAEQEIMSGGSLGRTFGFCQELVIRNSNAVVSVTHRMAERIREMRGVSPDKVFEVPNGGDAGFTPIPRSVARERLGLQGGVKIVAFVGSLSAWQGLPLLLRAFSHVSKSIPDAELFIIGEGSERGRLEALSNQVGPLMKVRFVGEVSRPKALEYVCAADVCTLPYQRMKLFDLIGRSPIKAYEYMACERPIVAGDFAGIGDEIRDSASGIVTPADDEMAFAEGIVSILADAEKARLMGEAGRRYLVQARSWESVSQQVERICSAVLSDRLPSNHSRALPGQAQTSNADGLGGGDHAGH